MVVAPVTVRGQDLLALAAIVSEDRPDVPPKEGLPPSLLADLMGQIRCDVLAFGGFDSGRQETWSTQFIPDGGEVVEVSDLLCKRSFLIEGVHCGHDTGAGAAGQGRACRTIAA